MGFSTPFFSLSEAQTPAQVRDDLRALNCKVIRTDCYWDWAQGSSGTDSYNWSGFDSTYKTFLDAGIEVIPILWGGVGWANSSGWMGNATNRQYYANFCSNAVSHFKPFGIKRYELWNEPNLSGSWYGNAPNASDYGNMVARAYPQMKAQDPTCTVIGGGLSPSDKTDPDNNPPQYIYAPDYTQDAFAGGAAGNCDAWSIHPYAYPYDPNQSDSWLSWNVGKQTRDRLASMGYMGLPIIYSEYGAPTATNDPNESGQIVTEQQQADIQMDHAFQQFAGQLPQVSDLHWYTYTDFTSYSTKEGFFGLVRAQGGYGQKTAYARWKVWNR